MCVCVCVRQDIELASKHVYCLLVQLKQYMIHSFIIIIIIILFLTHSCILVIRWRSLLSPDLNEESSK